MAKINCICAAGWWCSTQWSYHGPTQVWLSVCLPWHGMLTCHISLFIMVPGGIDVGLLWAVSIYSFDVTKWAADWGACLGLGILLWCLCAGLDICIVFVLLSIVDLAPLQWRFLVWMPPLNSPSSVPVSSLLTLMFTAAVKHCVEALCIVATMYRKTLSLQWIVGRLLDRCRDIS